MPHKIFLFLTALVLATATAQSQEDKKEELTMSDHTIVHKPSTMIIGIECRTSNQTDAGPIDIPKLWGKFYSENISGRIPNQASQEVIALYCDYEGDYTQPYSLVIGHPATSINEIPEGMVAKIIPSSSYAVFKAVGEHPLPLIETWKKVWGMDLNRTYTGDFEVYGQKFFHPPQEVEVYIAIDESK